MVVACWHLLVVCSSAASRLATREFLLSYTFPRSKHANVVVPEIGQSRRSIQALVRSLAQHRRGGHQHSVLSSRQATGTEETKLAIQAGTSTCYMAVVTFRALGPRSLPIENNPVRSIDI